jgi:hypothetical protein
MGILFAWGVSASWLRSFFGSAGKTEDPPQDACSGSKRSGSGLDQVMHAPTLLPLLWREHHHHRLREMRSMVVVFLAIRCRVRQPMPPELMG